MNLKRNLMILALFATSAPMIADNGGGLGAVIRAPFELTGDVVEGTGDVITGRNPVKEHEKRHPHNDTQKNKKSGKKTVKKAKTASSNSTTAK